MILFGLIALMHLLRMVYGTEVVVGSMMVPMWASALGFVVAGGLAYAVWWEQHHRRHA